MTVGRNFHVSWKKTLYSRERHFRNLVSNGVNEFVASANRPQGTVALRLVLWKAAFKGFLLDPITGIGIGNYRIIDQIIQQLRHIMKQSAKEKVDWDKVTADTTIKAIGFDSLSILDLVYDIQQQLNVEFEAEELARIDTVGRLASFLQSKMK